MGFIFAGLLAAVFAVFSSVSKPPSAPHPVALTRPTAIATATPHWQERPVDHLRSVLTSPVDEDDLALEHARPIQLQGDSAMQAPVEAVAGNSARTTDGCALPDGQMRQNCASFGAEPIVLNLKRELWLSAIHR
jgi:propanediol dehydratase small subunit